ncbi:MAG: hypothetical protein HY262_04710 [Chloroflexi bacterium]|nr:hypothetical protein [Chloroflexota bacterium]
MRRLSVLLSLRARQRFQRRAVGRRGESVRQGLRSVTVAGDDPAWAEVWSKTLFLAGRGAIADLACRRALAAWWCDEDGNLEMTAAARVRTVWIAAEA